MEILLSDPFIEICNWLYIDDLIKLTLVNQLLKTRIRQHKWNHIISIWHNAKYVKDVCTLSP